MGDVNHTLLQYLKSAEKSYALESVKLNGTVIQYLSTEMKEDKDVAIAAVKQNPHVFHLLDQYLQLDPEIRILVL